MKFYIIVLMVLLSTSFVNAQTLEGKFVTGEDVNLIQSCNNCTFVNISRVVNPLNVEIVSNVVMDKDGNFFNYTIDGSLITVQGEYKVYAYGDPNGQSATGNYNFFVENSNIFSFNLRQTEVQIFLVILGFFILGLILTKHYLIIAIIFIILGVGVLLNPIIDWFIGVAIIILGILGLYLQDGK